jgi:hypothetical protein
MTNISRRSTATRMSPPPIQEFLTRDELDALKRTILVGQNAAKQFASIPRARRLLN